MSAIIKQWKIKGQDAKKSNTLANNTGLNKVITSLLVNRGIDTENKISNFINLDKTSFYSPLLLKDMDKALSRINYGIRNGEKIWIYGDYDVDGVTSTSLLVKAFSYLGVAVSYYIPNRFDEGYGINKDAIEHIYNKGGNLIITVDCGITAIDEVEYANSLGLNVIITDHHQCQEKLPNACAIVNPKRTDCNYPFKELAGVGIAFKLAQGLLDWDTCQNLLDIATIGTVADVVELVDENRLIVKLGLDKLKCTENAGIKSLIEVSGLGERELDTYCIGFGLAPRINASGRLGTAAKSVELLLEENPLKAKEIALFLDKENKSRQEIEAQIMEAALSEIEQNSDNKENKALVVWGEDWHHGVIGIVASKLVDRYYKPCILLSVEKEEAKGSGRSIAGFNIFDSLMSCKDLFTKFGGHHMAAGLSLDKDNLSIFSERFIGIANNTLTEDDLIPILNFDRYLNFSSIDIRLTKDISQLQPFGQGNPQPTFVTQNVIIKEIRKIGNDGKHLKLKLLRDEIVLEGVAFGFGALADQVKQGDFIDLLYSIECNKWQGQERVQLNIKDIKKSLNNRSQVLCKDTQNIALKVPGTDSVKKSLGIQLSYINMDTLTDRIFHRGSKLSTLILCDTNHIFNSIINLCALKEGVKSILDLEEQHYCETGNLTVLGPYYSPSKEKGSLLPKEFDNIIITGLFLNSLQCDIIVNASTKIYQLSDKDYNKYMEEVMDTIIPKREDFIELYTCLKSRKEYKIETGNCNIKLSPSTDKEYSPGRLISMINILKESGIVDYNVSNNVYNLYLTLEEKKKVNLEETRLFNLLLQLKKSLVDN